MSSKNPVKDTENKEESKDKPKRERVAVISRKGNFDPENPDNVKAEKEQAKIAADKKAEATKATETK